MISPSPSVEEGVRFFFYGSLMDPDVLCRVLGEPLSPRQLAPAAIRHFRRVTVGGRRYPMLLPHPGGMVDGLAASGLSQRQARRLSIYEGSEYLLVPVRLADGQAAAVYLTKQGTGIDPRSWRLAAWRRRDKRAYLRRIGRFVDGYAAAARFNKWRNDVVTLAVAQPKWLSGYPSNLRF